MAPFYGWGSIASRLQSHYEEAVYFLALSPQKFHLSNIDGMKGRVDLGATQWF